MTPVVTSVRSAAADVETTEYMSERIDKFGTPEAYNHFAVGWAHAMNTPFQWTKQVASHWGGTRNATVVHWPKGIEATGEIRDQFSHVIDVAPTILDAAGIPQPDFVNGIQQKPIEGASMMPSFDNPEAPDVRSIQYFEMFGNRGVYYDGWTAVTKHKTPWMAGTEQLPAFDDDVWELYAPDDWSQANDLSAEQPDRLHELQRLWLIEAVKYDVLPIDDRLVERFKPYIAGRPQLIKGNRQKLFGGMGRLSEGSVLSLKNKPHSVTAEIEVPEGGADGAIVVQGGSTGGWGLYLHEGRATYCYNFLGVEHYFVRGDSPLEPGTRQVRMEFDYDASEWPWPFNRSRKVTALPRRLDGVGAVQVTHIRAGPGRRVGALNVRVVDRGVVRRAGAGGSGHSGRRSRCCRQQAVVREATGEALVSGRRRRRRASACARWTSSGAWSHRRCHGR